MPFFIIFVLIPLAEIAVFVSVGEEIGLINTLVFALFTAILGGAIVRYQGLKTLSEAKRQFASGAIPTQAMFDGVCLIASGATLITPGFITDTIGFLLLIPFVRRFLEKMLKKHTNLFPKQERRRGRRADDFIDGEFETLDNQGRTIESNKQTLGKD